MTETTSFRLALRIDRAARINAVTVEPWGDVVPVPDDGVVELTCSGPTDGLIEVVVRDATIVVFGWPGSVIDVVHSK